MARARVLLAPTSTMGCLTSADHCYCRAPDTRAGATSTHINDGPSDKSRSLLPPPTVATGDMTLDDRCYCWTHGTCTVATSTHRSDGSSDIRWSLLLWGTWHARGFYQHLQQRRAIWHQRVIATTTQSGDGLRGINCPSPLTPTLVMGYMTSIAHRH
jgi:hypothetical protein